MTSDRENFHIDSSAYRNLVLDTVMQLAVIEHPSQAVATLSAAAAKFGFTTFGINGLPPPARGADPLVLTESAPEGFRDLYIRERFYLVDHICAHARTTLTPFRFSEAPYQAEESRRHRRFLEMLASHGMANGLIVPVGRRGHPPACVWLAGPDPELHADAERAIQIIALFAAAKCYAIASRGAEDKSPLTAREREVLLWTARGRSASEIGEILGVVKRTVDAHAQAAAEKLGAANRTQAVVFAMLRNLIDV